MNPYKHWPPAEPPRGVVGYAAVLLLFAFIVWAVS